MPASSKPQQHFFQMVKAVQMGALKTKDVPSGVRDKIKKASKTISPKAANEFASKVEEGGDYDFSVLSFKEYLVVESAIVDGISELTESEIGSLVAILDEDSATILEEKKKSSKVSRTLAGAVYHRDYVKTKKKPYRKYDAAEHSAPSK